MPVGEPVPYEFSLKGNYPDPSGRKTTIEINLPNQAGVTVEIYNTPGQKVKNQRGNSGHRARTEVPGQHRCAFLQPALLPCRGRPWRRGRREDWADYRWRCQSGIEEPRRRRRLEKRCSNIFLISRPWRHGYIVYARSNLPVRSWAVPRSPRSHGRAAEQQHRARFY